jgi:hypothetical protein
MKNIGRITERLLRETEMEDAERGYTTAIEVSPAGGDGNIEWNAAVIEIVKIDDGCVAYRYSDDYIDTDWTLGTVSDAVDAAIDQQSQIRNEA